MEKYDLGKMLNRGARTPQSIQSISVDYIEARLNGDTIPDAIHPLIQLLEASSCHTAYSILESEASDRKSFPLLANEMDDLFGWMADRDHMHLYSHPGKVQIMLYIPRDELVARMVEVPNSLMKRIVIPRYTTIKVDRLYDFTLLYPIEIRLLPYSGGMLQIVYNTETRTPIQSISDNVLPWNVVRNENQENLVEIPLDLLQLSRKSDTYALAENMPFNETILISDNKENKFHFCRAFHSRDSKTWIEFPVVFDEINHDIQQLTGVIKVNDRLLDFYIPAIYRETQKVYPNVRIDIYSTLGDITVPFQLTPSDSFSMTLGEDLDDPSLTMYSGMVASLSRMYRSIDTLRGGENQIDFYDLRDRVIYNANKLEGDEFQNTPITPEQLRTSLKVRGFDLVQAKDDLTEREYYATRTLNSYGTDKYLSIREEERPLIFSTAISSGLGRLESTFDDLIQYPGVFDNGERITITPNTLMDYTSGALVPVPRGQYPFDLGTGIETRINLINLRPYVFTPFHYVLDAGDSGFDVRAYYIDKPKIVSRQFDHENPSAGLEVSTIGYDVIRTEHGYQIIVKSQVGESYAAIPKDDLSLQLAMRYSSDDVLSYIPGVLIGEEDDGQNHYYIWVFELITSYDFNPQNQIVITNAFFREPIERKQPIDLITDFTVIYGVSNNRPGRYVPGPIDKMMAYFLMGSDPIGVISETIKVELGQALTELAKPHRTIAGSRQYLLYEEDVYRTYESDVYEMDPVTQRPKFEIIDGKVVRNKLHSKGDPELDINGEPVIKHYKGTTQRNHNGDPIVISDRPTARFVDVFVMDGIYFYANDQSAIQERDYISEQIVYQCLPDLSLVNKRRLEQTAILLYPKKTVGNIKVLVDDSREILINSQLTFKVSILITKVMENDPEYKSGLERLISEAITSELRKSTVAKMNIIAKVKNNTDENLVGLDITIISNGQEFHTFTAKDDSVRCNIRRLARLGDDGRITVREDIGFDVRVHDE